MHGWNLVKFRILLYHEHPHLRILQLDGFYCSICAVASRFDSKGVDMRNEPGSVDHFLATLEDWQSLAISKLRKIITSAAGDIKEKLLNSVPAYESGGPCCSIKTLKNQVRLEFWRGEELSGKYGVFSGNGKEKRHIKINSTDDIHEKLFTEIVRTAVKLNKTLGDPSKRVSF